MRKVESDGPERSLVADHVVERFIDEVGSRPELTEYTMYLRSLYQDKEVHERIVEPSIRWFDQPADLLNPDAERPEGIAFYAGALLGLRVVDFAGGDSLLDAIGSARLDINQDRLPHRAIEIRRQYANSYLSAGNTGYANMRPYHQHFSQRIIGLMPKSEYGPYLTSGFGMIALLADGALDLESRKQRLRNRARMREVLRTLPSADWDTELRTLTPEL